MTLTQKITPFLWFDHQAEEAARLYTSLFPDSKVLGSSKGPDGKPMVVVFQLAGQQYQALNGGSHFKFNEAMSLFVTCESQDEVDRLWMALTSDGGREGQCGWLKDRFGVSWQIVPRRFMELMGGPDPKKSAAVMQAMLQMKKFDVAGLEAAYANA